MQIIYKKSFIKSFDALPARIKSKTLERVDLLLKDQFHFLLNNHGLSGELLGYRSINISGDIRLIYKEENNIYIFYIIGNHSNLYGM